MLDVPDWAGHRAGQHLDVRLTAEDGYVAERSYSIASAPGEPVAITVQRLDDGEVSPYLTDGTAAAATSSSCAGRSAATSSGTPTARAARCCCWPADRESSRSGRSCGTAERTGSDGAGPAAVLGSLAARRDLPRRARAATADVAVTYTLTRRQPPGWTGHARPGRRRAARPRSPGLPGRIRSPSSAGRRASSRPPRTGLSRSATRRSG